MKTHLPTPSIRFGECLILVCLLMSLQGCGPLGHSAEVDGYFLKDFGTRVRFERTGGMAGMRTAITIDSKSLPGEEAERLRNLIQQARFFDLPEEILGPSRPDEFHYLITITTDRQKHTVRTADTAAPAPLKPLIEWLNGQARGAPGPSERD